MTSPRPPGRPPLAPLDRSYRAVFAIPDLGRVVLSMQLARIAQAMVSVALVLFSLAEYDSPAVAGVVTFAILLPGILLSPIAGALLDRHGRVRLIVIDYIVAMATMLLVGGLAMAGMLSAPLLVVIAAVSSMTGPFSQTGLRSLFPMMAPKHLWERVNALDSSGYVVATIVGPPLAAAMVAILGPRLAVMAIAIPYALAALILLPVREPTGHAQQQRPAAGRRVAGPALCLGQPVAARARLLDLDPQPRGRHLDHRRSPSSSSSGSAARRRWWASCSPCRASPVSSRWACPGASTPGAGNGCCWSSRWRFMGPAALLLLPAVDPVDIALAWVGAVRCRCILNGLLNGPMDIGLFTMRQRRTDPAMLGRAFAVSMAFNFLGYPIGAAIGGMLATTSLDAAIWLAVGACVLGTLLAAGDGPSTG